METYGFNKGYWGLESKTAKQILDDNSLTTSSGHYDLNEFMLKGATDDDLKKYVDQCIEGAQVLKQNTLYGPGWIRNRERWINLNWWLRN